MEFKADASIVFDFLDAMPKIIENLSGIAGTGEYLWVAADEKRLLQCFVRKGQGFVLDHEVKLDDLIADIPGTKELDLESLDIADGRLWLCGSHCRIRDKTDEQKIVDVPSRQILAAIELTENGGVLGTAEVLPFAREGSLRQVLADDLDLKPFMKLPTKENGFDIEGLAVVNGDVLLGLRGPVIDGVAVVVRLALGQGLAIDRHKLEFLDLDGLGVRDLARVQNVIMVLAGPMGEDEGPFCLYSWKPEANAAAGRVQEPTKLLTWPPGKEKPEGLCALELEGQQGLLVVYDSPDKEKRVNGSKYSADWVALEMQ